MKRETRQAGPLVLNPGPASAAKGAAALAGLLISIVICGCVAVRMRHKLSQQRWRC